MIALALAVACALGADPTPPAPAGAVTPAVVPTPPVPLPPIVVMVTARSAAGVVTPGAGAEVRLELVAESRMGDDSGGTLERAWLATTDADGKAVFVGVPEPPPQRSFRAVARWAGVEWPAAVGDRSDPVAIAVYAVASDASALQAMAILQIDLREENLGVDLTMQLGTGDSPVAIDTDVGEGLRVPLPMPAVYGEPLDEGFLPPRPDPERSRFEVNPPLGRLVVERGAMVYRGLVPPTGIIIDCSYAIPYDEDTAHTIAFRPPMKLTGLRVSSKLSDKAAPALALRAPFEAMIRPEGLGESRLLWAITPPAAGEPVFVDIADTPSRHVLWRPIAAALGAFVVVVLTLVFLRTRRAARPAMTDPTPAA